MRKLLNRSSRIALGLSLLFMLSCEDDGEDVLDLTANNSPQQSDYTNLLTNQIDGVIIPSMNYYAKKTETLETAASNFSSSSDQSKLDALKIAFKEAYLAYQAVAVHHYYVTANANLIRTSNLFPIDTSLLANFIASRAYNFGTTAQERANGFPALDYLLYGPSDALVAFQADINRVDYVLELSKYIHSKARSLSQQWSGSIRENFIANGGTALGSSISVQLNESLLYYEKQIREDKVGIPIGRLGPNDSPIAADPRKIEALYESQRDGNESFTFDLLKAAVEEMEDIYLGTDSLGIDGQGYDDIVKARGQAAIDSDIKDQFQNIYDEIANRSSISGDDALYNSIQRLITLYKSDLFPVLNVQDADGLNDGD